MRIIKRNESCFRVLDEDKEQIIDGLTKILHKKEEHGKEESKGNAVLDQG